MSINFWTIREQFVFQETIRVPNKINSCPPKNVSRLDEPIHEHSWREKRKERAEKNQQFWAFFRRFDINIFNLLEHFPPRIFTYSARNFSLPSPNLN